MNWVLSDPPHSQGELQAVPPQVEVKDGSKAAEMIEHLTKENAKLQAILQQLQQEAKSATTESGSSTPCVRAPAREGKQSAIFVCGDGSDTQKELYVAVMDVNDEDWWEVIEPQTLRDPGVSEMLGPDSEYVLVEENEVSKAMSAFVAANLKRYPEAKTVPPAQLKKLLDVSFSSLKEKGMLLKMYEWGCFAYTSYGWANYAWHLYSDPAMAKLASKWLFTAGSWAVWLVL